MAKAYFFNEDGDKVEVDLSNSIHHFLTVTTTEVPKHLFIHTQLERRSGLDKYDCVVNLAIDAKKYSQSGELIETVYSNRREMYHVENCPVEQIENKQLTFDFTLEAKRGKHGKWS